MGALTSGWQVKGGLRCPHRYWRFTRAVVYIFYSRWDGGPVERLHPAQPRPMTPFKRLQCTRPRTIVTYFGVLGSGTYASR